MPTVAKAQAMVVVGMEVSGVKQAAAMVLDSNRTSSGRRVRSRNVEGVRGYSWPSTLLCCLDHTSRTSRLHFDNRCNRCKCRMRVEAATEVVAKEEAAVAVAVVAVDVVAVGMLQNPTC